ncbi:MAG TPA: hypothetical protein VK929_10670 [Longimicrobiales bacterium]|nr:hypothetical protein [Longimicrobiales bacterium]
MYAAAATRKWLSERSADVPESLLARMERAVDDVALDHHGVQDDAGVADVLAAAAVLCLREAAADCDVRDAALPLLAADALMTAAFEAAAGVDDPATALQALRALCDEYDVHRIAAQAGVPG